MNVTVLMPSCDWPRGSGLLNPNTREAIRSVIDQPLDDLELWIRTDGPQPKIVEFVESLHCKKISLSEGPVTRSSGNHQRRWLMERLIESKRGGLFAFHDDDDAYFPGVLKEMHDLSVENGVVPVLARHVRGLLSHIMTPEAIENTSGFTWAFKMPVSFAASIFPVMDAMPLWPTEGGYYADLPFANSFVQWFEDQKKQVILLDRTVTRIRPMEHEGSLVPEFH